MTALINAGRYIVMDSLSSDNTKSLKCIFDKVKIDFTSTTGESNEKQTLALSLCSIGGIVFNQTVIGSIKSCLESLRLSLFFPPKLDVELVPDTSKSPKAFVKINNLSEVVSKFREECEEVGKILKPLSTISCFLSIEDRDCIIRLDFVANKDGLCFVYIPEAQVFEGSFHDIEAFASQLAQKWSFSQPYDEIYSLALVDGIKSFNYQSGFCQSVFDSFPLCTTPQKWIIYDVKRQRCGFIQGNEEKFIVDLSLVLNRWNLNTVNVYTWNPLFEQIINERNRSELVSSIIEERVMWI